MATYSEIADRNMEIAREMHGGEAASVWPKAFLVLAVGLLAITLLVASGQVPPEPSQDFAALVE